MSSEPVSPVPREVPGAIAVDFSSEELVLLAQFADAEPLFAVDASDLAADGWNAVFNGLMARGVIEERTAPDGELGAGFAPGYAPLVGVALLATRATSVSFRDGDRDRSFTYLREPEVAVRHERTPHGLHRLLPIDGEAVVGEVQDLVGSIMGPASGGPVGVSTRVSTADYVHALDTLDSDGVDAACEALAEAADYLRAVHAARTSIVVADWIVEDDGSLAGEVLSLLDAGELGLYIVDQDEASVLLELVDPVSAVDRVASAIS